MMWKRCFSLEELEREKKRQELGELLSLSPTIVSILDRGADGHPERTVAGRVEGLCAYWADIPFTNGLVLITEEVPA